MADFDFLYQPSRDGEKLTDWGLPTECVPQTRFVPPMKLASESPNARPLGLGSTRAQPCAPASPTADCRHYPNSPNKRC